MYFSGYQHSESKNQLLNVLFFVIKRISKIFHAKHSFREHQTIKLTPLAVYVDVNLYQCCN